MVGLVEAAGGSRGVHRDPPADRLSGSGSLEVVVEQGVDDLGLGGRDYFDYKWNATKRRRLLATPCQLMPIS